MMRALLLILALLAAPSRAGWTAGAWPACEHVGSREFAPGVLYKQIWARDLYHALEERCYAISTNGSTNVWALLRPDWWTADGVTNRVVRYEGASQDATDYSNLPRNTVLEAVKSLTARLAPHFHNPSQAAPGDFAAEWAALQASGGGRVDVPVSTNAYTAWVWECPGVEHSQTYVLNEQLRLGTNGYRFTTFTLPEHAQLPRSLLGITPYRLVEGLCDPDAAATAPLWVFRDSAITGVCNWATFGTVTEASGSATADWQVAPACLAAGGNPGQAILRLTDAGAGSTGVVVEVTVDTRLELVAVNAPISALGSVQWHTQPVLIRLASLTPGQIVTISLSARCRRDQGTSPHDDGLWYWSDFGWDAARKAIQALSNTVIGVNSDHAAVPLQALYVWAEGDGDNEFSTSATSTQSYLYLTDLPGDEIEAGSYADLVGDAEADEATFYTSLPTPAYWYEVAFDADPTPTETNTIYECVWRADWRGEKGKPRIDRRRLWPPTNVVAVVRFFADVESYTAPTGQQTWQTVELGDHTFTSPGTDDVTLSAVVGDGAADPAHYPGDPSAAMGHPLGGGIIEINADDYFGDPDERRGNGFRNSKTWRDPFLLTEYTWSYP